MHAITLNILHKGGDIMDFIIPDLEVLRSELVGFSYDVEIDTGSPLFDDPLVDLRDFGFDDAESYYAKPNKLTGEVLPGVKNEPFVRKDLAQRLVKANEWLKGDSMVKGLLGENVRLKIDDAYRSFATQKYAHDTAWPQVIRNQNPKLTDRQVAEIVGRYCADPGSEASPTPHQTGGAVDVSLFYLSSNEPVPRGYKSGAAEETAFADFYESKDYTKTEYSAEEFAAIVSGRRILYYAMTVVAGLQSNPKEIWHYGIGDPLSAFVGGYKPYYGVV